MDKIDLSNNIFPNIWTNSSFMFQSPPPTRRTGFHGQAPAVQAPGVVGQDGHRCKGMLGQAKPGGKNCCQIEMITSETIHVW